MAVLLDPPEVLQYQPPSVWVHIWESRGNLTRETLALNREGLWTLSGGIFELEPLASESMIMSGRQCLSLSYFPPPRGSYKQTPSHDDHTIRRKAMITSTSHIRLIRPYWVLNELSRVFRKFGQSYRFSAFDLDQVQFLKHLHGLVILLAHRARRFGKSLFLSEGDFSDDNRARSQSNAFSGILRVSASNGR